MRETQGRHLPYPHEYDENPKTRKCKICGREHDAHWEDIELRD